MNTILCETNKRNTAWKSFCEVNLSAYRKILVAPVGHSFATVAAASSYSGWLAEIIKTTSTGRTYPFKPAANVKPENQETTYAETQMEGKKKVKSGKEQFTMEIEANPYVMERLYTFDGIACSIYIVDYEENILGWSVDGTKFNAFSVESLTINPMTQSDGSNPRYIPVTVTLSNPSEWNKSPMVAKPDAGFVPSELEGLYDIAVTPTLLATQAVGTLYVTTEIIGTGRGLTGANNVATTPDFKVTRISTGVDAVVTAIVETPAGSGKYALTISPVLTAGTPYNVYTTAPSLAVSTSVLRTTLPCESLASACLSFTV